MKNITLHLRHEANLTSYGTHDNGNCKPVIAIELQRVFNSLTDAAEFFGCDHALIWKVLNGYQNTIGLWERDVNGKRIRRICRCHLKYASDMESAMNMLMENGRGNIDALNKANEEVEDLKKENAQLNAELAEFRAWKKAKEDHKKAISVAESVLEKCKAKETKAQEEYQLAIARRQNAERELAELKARNVYA